MKTIISTFILTGLTAFGATEARIGLEIINLAAKPFYIYNHSQNTGVNPGNRAFLWEPGDKQTLFVSTNEIGTWFVVRLSTSYLQERTNSFNLSSSDMGRVRQIVLNNVGDISVDTWTDQGYTVASIPDQADVDWLGTLWKGFGTSTAFFGFAFLAGIVRKGLGSEVV